MPPDDANHENLDLEDTLADFASLMPTEDSFIVKKLSREALLTPWNFRVIGVFFPRENLSEDEAGTLQEYVQKGGGLLITGERGGEDKRTLMLNELSSRFGIKFKSDRIFDPIHSYSSDKAAATEAPTMGRKKDFVKITKFADHVINDGVKEVAYFEGCSLDMAPENQLAWSDSMSFADENADGAWSVGEKIGSLPVAGFATMDQGRVVCIGDTSLMTRRTLKMADNRKFIHNIIKWLAKGRMAQVKVMEKTLKPVG